MDLPSDFSSVPCVVTLDDHLTDGKPGIHLCLERNSQVYLFQLDRPDPAAQYSNASEQRICEYLYRCEGFVEYFPDHQNDAPVIFSGGQTDAASKYIIHDLSMRHANTGIIREKALGITSMADAANGGVKPPALSKIVAGFTPMAKSDYEEKIASAAWQAVSAPAFVIFARSTSQLAMEALRLPKLSLPVEKSITGSGPSGLWSKIAVIRGLATAGAEYMTYLRLCELRFMYAFHLRTQSNLSFSQIEEYIDIHLDVEKEELDLQVEHLKAMQSENIREGMRKFKVNMSPGLRQKDKQTAEYLKKFGVDRYLYDRAMAMLSMRIKEKTLEKHQPSKAGGELLHERFTQRTDIIRNHLEARED